MGLKNFLKQQGFIEDEPAEKPEQAKNPDNIQKKETAAAPSFFPLSQPTVADNSAYVVPLQSDPSFVTPLQQNTPQKEQPDPTFIKFFEDELVKDNMPGPDYFEFRQMLIKTQQKMAAKGIAAPEVILQAVLTSFEAQDIPPAKLIEAARHYKDALKQRNDDFIKGAETEKNNQFQKRQAVLQTHNDNIKKLQQQLQQVEQQKKQLEDALKKENTQLDVDKSLGREAIEKIDKAEKLITLAHEHMQSTIDADIKTLQSV